WDAGVKAWKEGKQEEVITRMNGALQSQLRLTGPRHRNTALLASWLAGWHRARKEWRQEAIAQGVVLEASRHLYGERDWRAVDARWGERTARLRLGCTEQENQLWDRADALNRRVVSLWRQWKSREALPLAKQVLRARLALAGRAHPDVAQAFLHLAAQHERLG